MEENQVSEATEAEATEAPATEEVSERPEWLPEKFSDPADLGKAYKALESKLGEKEDDVRNRLMEELNEQASEGVPSSAGEYELPDIIDSEEAIESDLLKEWADHCHSNGYTHDEFKKGIENIIQSNPVPVIPMALRGLWGSWFSRYKGKAMRGLPKRIPDVTLISGTAIAPDLVSCSLLQQRVSQLRGDCR